MAVRFVIGRAGTGKTALCIRELRAEMVRDPLGSGPQGGSLLWIVPEQGTFSAERQLLTTSDGLPIRGSFRTQVLGFRRLAMLVGAEIGITAARGTKPMDDLARTVLLEELLRREKGNLSVFRAAAERPGFAKVLDKMLRELRQHEHTGVTLRDAAGQVEPAMARKLLDLALLLDAWSVEMERTGVCDFEHVMHTAALRAGESALIRGARVWVDAISAMSVLEMRFLAALGQHAQEVTVTLLADPDSDAIQTLRRTIDTQSTLFSRTERLYRRLTEKFRQHQVRITKTVALRERFRFAAPDLARMEAELFSDEAIAAAPAPMPAVPSAGISKAKKGQRGPAQFSLFDPPPADATAPAGPGSHGRVEIWTCGDPESEVRAVAGAIRALMLGTEGESLRCRQMGVIVPDLEGHEDALRRIFTEHGIPHFIDRRRTIAHHPLVELLRSALGVVTSRWDREHVMLYLKTGLAGVSAEDVALVENYLIEHGISHVPWQKAWTWVAPNEEGERLSDRTPESLRLRLARVNQVREKVWKDLHGFVDECASETATADAGCFARALLTLLAKLDVQSELDKWIAAARAGGQLELAQIHEQAGREIHSMLHVLSDLFNGRQWKIEDFQRVLETALEQLALGLIPPTVDQVLISSVDRSRLPEMEAVFVVGAVEGQFPKVPQEDPLLSDEQRAAFNACAAEPINDGADHQLLEMPFLDYVALTRSRRHLVITHAVADRTGKALAESRHLGRIAAILGDRLGRRFFDRDIYRETQNITTGHDLMAGMAAWGRHVLTAGKVQGPPLMPALYNILLASPDSPLLHDRDAVWKALRAQPSPALSQDLANRLFPPQRPLRLSVSQLESFAACPLRYFLQYTLSLRPRAEFTIDNLAMGRWQHRILERIYNRVLDGDLHWPQDPVALSRAVSEELAAASDEMHAEIADRTAGYAAAQTRLRRVIALLVEADRRRALQGTLRPRAVELSFDGTNVQRHNGRLVSLPVLRLPPAAGERDLLINGKIDRLDMSPDNQDAAVIDYKSAAGQTLEMARVLYGISLQLPVYAMVVRDLAHHSPLAALYINLGLPLRAIDHAGEDASKTPETDDFYQDYPPRGMLNARHIDRLDRILQPDPSGESGGGRSYWYKAAFNKGGEISKTSDLLSNTHVHLVLDFARQKIAQLASALAAGTIAPHPYRFKKEIPCDFCDFKALCPFDRNTGTYADIPPLSRSDALAAMQASIGEK